MENSSTVETTTATIEAPARAGVRPPAPPRPQAAQAPLASGADTLERIGLIERAIEEIRPFLKRDGGDCELVDVNGNTIYVKLTGACVGCHMASMTVMGVQQRLMEKLGVPLRVIPVG